MRGRVPRDRRQISRPRLPRAPRNLRLRAMIDDDLQVAMALEGPQERGQIRRSHQRVEAQAKLRQGVDRGLHLGPRDPRWIREVLQDRPHAFQQRIARQVGERPGSVDRGKIGPADHAPNEPTAATRDVEHEFRFGDRRRRLHQHRGLNAGSGKEWPQIAEIEVAIDRRERTSGLQPAVVGPGERPDVVV